MVTENNFSKMAQFISELRKEKKLTQKDLAEQLGITDKAVSKWERGVSCPDISLLSKLSQVLGVTTSELLNGEKAGTSAPEIDAIVETTLQYADTTMKSVITKNARWKYVAIVFAVSLLGVLAFMGCSWAIDSGMGWSILPVNIIAFVWAAAIAGIFVMEKNKLASLLLCGFMIFLTTFYYSVLNQSPSRDLSTFNGFPRDNIPHYTIILVLFAVSAILTMIFFSMRKKEISEDKMFFLAAVSATIILLSILTVPAMMDYVDLNGLGVNPKFTVLLLLTLLINGVSLALLAKRYKRQIVEKRKAGNNYA